MRRSKARMLRLGRWEFWYRHSDWWLIRESPEFEHGLWGDTWSWGPFTVFHFLVKP